MRPETDPPPPKKKPRSLQGSALGKRSLRGESGSRFTPSGGLESFFYCLLFLGGSLAAGYAAVHGAAALSAAGHPLPGPLTSPEALFCLVVLAVGVAPQLLFYRARTVLRALLGAGLGAALGFCLVRVFGVDEVQSFLALLPPLGGLPPLASRHLPLLIPSLAALASFAAVLFVFGLFGETKAKGLARDA